MAAFQFFFFSRELSTHLDVFYADSLADTSKLKRVFATVRCDLAKSETRINNFKECGVN